MTDRDDHAFDGWRSQHPNAAGLDIWRAALAHARSAEPPTSFAEWVRKNIPPGTVISDPEWWIPRMYRAARAEPQRPLDDEGLALLRDALTWLADCDLKDAINAYLAKPRQQQEPVAWHFPHPTGLMLPDHKAGSEWMPLYTAPPTPSAEDRDRAAQNIQCVALRDYFAAEAMKPLLAQAINGSAPLPEEDWRLGVAFDAYRMADAILIARTIPQKGQESRIAEPPAERQRAEPVDVTRDPRAE